MDSLAQICRWCAAVEPWAGSRPRPHSTPARRGLRSGRQALQREGQGMIELYTWGTPNGKKASVMLEEVGLPYTLHAINIGKGDQFTPEYVAINPNSKIPAIVDLDGPGGRPIKVFESGAILIYLAEKTGKLLSTEPRARMEALEWLMFQMGGVGPMFGQAHHFLRQAPEQIAYAQERYVKEVRRLYGVMNT